MPAVCHQQRDDTRVSLYTQLTSQKMSEDETVTDYMVKAETSVTSLSTANELISASLLIAMVLKNLPQEFKMFHAVIGQNTLKFSQFKLELRAFEESEKSCATQDRGESVMKTKDRHDNPNVKCYSCGKLGHMSYNSRSKKRQKISNTRRCTICWKPNHYATRAAATEKATSEKIPQDTIEENYEFCVPVNSG